MGSIKNNFFNENIFLHTHIEKCGGSTLNHYFETMFGKDYVCDLRPYPPRSVLETLRNYPDLQKKLPEIKLLSGHIHYNTLWSKIIPKNQQPSRLTSCSASIGQRKPLYIASIRHPIERLISLFRYVRSRPEHILYDETIKNNHIDRFIQKLIQTNSFRMNSEMCSLFIGGQNATQALEEAKNSFRHRYFAVVPYDKTHELAHIVADVFRLPRVNECLINSSDPNEKSTLSAEIRAVLEEKCQSDILFYHYMMNNYQEKLARAKLELEHLLA